jgi:CorA-like Mg2+ transporter protein
MDRISWEQKLRLFLQESFLDYRRLLPESVNSLAIGDQRFVPLQSHSAFISRIDTYLRSSPTVGSVPDDTKDGSFDLKFLNAILSIRGAPRLSLLQFLGQQLALEPAILLEHFNFPDTFRIRALPSRQKSSILISMISLGYWGSAGGRFSQQQLDARTRQQKADLFDGDQSGAEHCRRVNLHPGRHFSVEQDVSFLVYASEPHAWSGIMINDSGTQSRTSPWSTASSSRPIAHFFPMSRFGQCALDTNGLAHPIRDKRDSRNYLSPDPCQSRGDCGESMSYEDQVLCLEDPILFLCDLLATSALSWTRFFAFLHALYNTDSHGDPSLIVDFLRRDKLVLEHAQSYFHDTLSFLHNRSRLQWPSCRTREGIVRVDEVVSNTKQDFEFLNRIAASLSTLCSEKISIEMNTASILESKKGLAQAERVEMLTILAYTFVPLGLISSIFGMNVSAFNPPGPSIARFWEIAVPVTLFCLLIPLYPRIMSFFRTM